MGTMIYDDEDKNLDGGDEEADDSFIENDGAGLELGPQGEEEEEAGEDRRLLTASLNVTAGYWVIEVAHR